MPHDHHAPFELRKDLARRLAQYRELILGSLEGGRMHERRTDACPTRGPRSCRCHRVMQPVKRPGMKEGPGVEPGAFRSSVTQIRATR